MGDKPKGALFDEESTSSSSASSDSSEEENKLSVNKAFAKRYQERKQREELKQIEQDRGGIDSDDSSSEEEDEEGNQLTKSVNIQFVKTIKALRSKESSIYDPNKRFFDDIDDDEQDGGDKDRESQSEKNKKSKKFKDVLRDQILEQMSDDDEARNAPKSVPMSHQSKLAYDAQQEELRKDFLKRSGVADDGSSDAEGEGDDWMVVKKKAELSDGDDEVAAEIDQLAEMSKNNNSDTGLVDPRGEVKNGEQFLLDYIKNRKWLDRDTDDVIVDDDDSSVEEVDRADDFEATYNFRFEQAAEETATSGASLSNQMYARGQTMTTLRRQDTTRKESRLARKERKMAERKAKEEQLKRLKNAKRLEMNQKLSQIKGVLGAADDEAVDEAALMKMLEGDYDPEKFEKSMQDAYGDDFYEQEESEWKTDKDVATFLANDEENGVAINDTSYYEGEENDDEEFDEKAGEEASVDDDVIDEGVGGPEETELEKKLKAKMQDELYKLDYEDIVAGMPTRFKYRQVEANDYGLTTQDILMARDTTLKQYVSLKKMAPYNDGNEFRPDSKKRRRFRQLLKQDMEEQVEPEEEKKKDILANAEIQGNEQEPDKKKRRRLKKGKKREKSTHDEADEGQENGSADPAPTKPEEAENDKPKRRRKKKGKKEELSDSKGENVSAKVMNDISPGAPEAAPSDSTAPKNDKKKKKKNKKKKADRLVSLPSSRLSSYGL
eukprot:CAMPEP_0117006888 /NCGR_PEP_ID=MMETSP0472-20121206/6963_1 /TAXON_ID=693140 ORGANISM="Tiarina fusus, Strain LIS" /NCGR_SAMPLE_ID=MMETSP0472 /ASSEMBLY_ACC=CAM_ASM_000603 /LENGTH=720 /DNA_ID=CAMNT_0004708497 /DNA_START=58 /DNA_END=2220 /DNA_ORIENTATION=+